MNPIAFKTAQREIYEKTLALKGDPSGFCHSIHYFFDQFKTNPGWSIGPMEKEERLTFKKPSQWQDPCGIGWESGFLFNPSLIEKDEKLYLFYRASPWSETLCSRIGMAVYEEGKGWTDFSENPVVYPLEENEIAGVEDPKIYCVGDSYLLFYNAISPMTAEIKAELEAEGLEAPSVVCDIMAMTSKDLLHWERLGLVVPRSVSRYWAKGAVLPRNPSGEAVKIGGEYLMYLSEGCGDKQVVGHSADGISWHFEEECYMDLGEMGTICELACVLTDYTESAQNAMLFDVFYKTPQGVRAGLQALYSTEAPFSPVAFNQGATLSWGGIIDYKGKWTFAQGWDAEQGSEELYFYTLPRKK